MPPSPPLPSPALPLVAVTMGDPTGIGPEVIVGAWTSPRLHLGQRVGVIGHPDILRRAVQLMRRRIEVVEVESLAAVPASANVMPCLKAGSDDAVAATPCKIDARGGQAAYDALHRAVELAQAGQIDAITTAPLHKAALWQAGHHFPGHTELLAELCGVKDVAMMLYLGPRAFVDRATGLGVAHVTLHMALRDVFASLSEQAILVKARLADTIMQRLGVERPRIAVCALNPHAGEEGLFGDEEIKLIRPAVEAGRREGLSLTGPLPTDTLMVRARAGEFDAVVAMYHDQGHIALKLMGMHHAVNITLGLPIIRTSVAHGTAHDIAWQGRADSRSLVEAVTVAAALRARG